MYCNYNYNNEDVVMIMIILMLIYDLKLEPMPEMRSLLKILLFFSVSFLAKEYWR